MGERVRAGGEAVKRESVEALRDRLGTPAWLFAAARQKYGWASGQELTEEEYREAVEAAASEVIANA